ncbi:MAG: hypothetical protein HKN13_13715 [Rhodothermales bacterium]|nr:hypothetical protein [Rhodothermales bacterium]
MRERNRDAMTRTAARKMGDSNERRRGKSVRKRILKVPLTKQRNRRSEGRKVALVVVLNHPPVPAKLTLARTKAKRRGEAIAGGLSRQIEKNEANERNARSRAANEAQTLVAHQENRSRKIIEVQKIGRAKPGLSRETKSRVTVVLRIREVRQATTNERPTGRRQSNSARNPNLNAALAQQATAG